MADLSYIRYLLPNGLTVILHRDENTPIATVNVLYKVGSKHEDPKKTGLAHLFEHLMFTGTEAVPDYDDPVQKAGGENNAFTSNDITNYYCYAPAKNIGLLLWLEADRMAALTLDKTSFEVQKKVVLEEFYETCIDEPYGDMWHHINDMAYRKYPYNWPVIGKTPRTVEKLTWEDAMEFYNRYYSPQNAILTVTGNIEIVKVQAMIEKWFGSMKKDLPLAKVVMPEPAQRKQRRRIIHGQVTVPALFMAFHIPKRTDRGYYICDLLSDVLANGRSARLYERLVKEKPLFASIDAFTNGVSDEGLLVIEGYLAADVDIYEAERAVWNELEHLMETLIPATELEKIINKTLIALETSCYSVTNKAMNLSYFEYLGDIELINREEAIYQSITVKDIKKYAQCIFKPHHASVIHYLPANTGAEQIAV